MWRKLRRLGVVQVVDGLVALPLDARTREQLEWLADEVLDAGGESSLWIAEAASGGGGGRVVVHRRRTLAKLRREIRRIKTRSVPMR